ncbi:MAG: sigma-70 family RNA polymerase sigma factor [Phycisphaeraceae bacterium]|nr:sigma-70 family RNA polymerase sigma factor [Phycisphaeraceae bacterium]MCW5755128.1 sigma-70 family RNA polymerase sigma factor [Phycisphaeraceae bacterium]
MHESEFEEFLGRARGGDRASLMRLLEVFGAVVRERISQKIAPWMRTTLDEDDVMQVTYVEAVTRLGRFEGGGVKGFTAWLHRLAENNLIDAVRAMEAAKRPNPRKKVSPAAHADESHLGLVELLGATFTTPSRDAAKREAKGFLDAALSRLPPDYQRVIRLYDLQGRSIEEVCTEMGRSQGAVFMLRARAHDRLKETLGSESRFFSIPS